MCVATVMCPLDVHDIISLLETHGIHRNSGKYEDYEKAKNVVIKGEIIDRREYEVAVRWIKEYVGV